MAFVPRLTRPVAGNKYYITKDFGGYSNAIKGKPMDSQCNVLHNCVGYAYGRFNEIGAWGSCKYLAPVNAEDFMSYKGSCSTGTTPKLGACMVWSKGKKGDSSDGAGHVAIVEKIISDTEIITSESGYNASKPFWTQTRKKGSDGNWGADSSYKFEGFIYNPAPCCEEVEEKPATSDPGYNVNDIVEFTGTVHFTSAAAASGKPTKPGLAKITAKANGKHPYHLRSVNEKGNFISGGVYGWCNIEDIQPRKEEVKPAPVPAPTTPKVEDKNFKVGDKIIVNGKIYYYGNGGVSYNKNNETMYVSDLVSSKSYKYWIGVSYKKGGVRVGWANPDILTKV